MQAEEILIRRMKEEDLPQVLTMEKRYFPDPWSERIYRDSMALDNYIFLVAEDAGTYCIAGYASLMGIGEEGDVMNIAVDERRRRKGIAEKLLQELFRLGDQAGICDYTLEVRKTNLAAVSLYQKMGFCTEGVRRGYYEHPREDALIMWRRKTGEEDLTHQQRASDA